LSFVRRGCARLTARPEDRGPSGTRTESAGGGGWAAVNGAKWLAALTQAGYAAKADLANEDQLVMAEVVLSIMVIYVTMLYGPMPAFLIEMFPTKAVVAS
jgi:hypothetical protein